MFTPHSPILVSPSAPAAPPLLPSGNGFSRRRDAPIVPFRAKATWVHGGRDEARACLSPPASGSASVASHDGSPASCASSPSALSPASAPVSGAMSHWKATLKARCVERVQAHRHALLSKLRGMQAQQSLGAAQLPSFAPSSAAAQADASLESSLRSIIDDQLRRRVSAPAIPRAVVCRDSTLAEVVEAASEQSATAAPPAEGLSADEYVELMQQLQEEVMRELHAEDAAAAVAAAGYGAHSFYSTPSPFDPDLDAAALMEADEAAWEEAQHASAMLPCPACHRPVSHDSAAGVAWCAACGMNYACENVEAMRAHLSDAFEVHASRCAAMPTFVPQQSAAASSSAAPACSRATLALTCGQCHTWLTLPLGTAAAAMCSPPASQEPDDEESHMHE